MSKAEDYYKSLCQIPLTITGRARIGAKANAAGILVEAKQKRVEANELDILLVRSLPLFTSSTPEKTVKIDVIVVTSGEDSGKDIIASLDQRAKELAQQFNAESLIPLMDKKFLAGELFQSPLQSLIN